MLPFVISVPIYGYRSEAVIRLIEKQTFNVPVLAQPETIAASCESYGPLHAP